MLIRLSSVGLLFVVILLFDHALAQPKDVLGWREARWGMTEEQLLETFKGEIRRLPKQVSYSEGDYATLGINNIKIARGAYNARFIMDAHTKTLKTVQIVPATDCEKSITSFKSLEMLLMKKYGSPSYKGDLSTKDFSKRVKGHKDLVTKWYFPTSSIDLNYLEDRSTSFKFLTLNYRPTVTEDIDKL